MHSGADIPRGHLRGAATCRTICKRSVDRTTVSIRIMYRLPIARHSLSLPYSNPMNKVASLTQEALKTLMLDTGLTSASRTCLTDQISLPVG